MVDWAAHYNRIYGMLGVPATLTIDGSDGGEYALTVIDKTEGVVVEGEGGNVQTVRAAAVVRMSELAEQGVAAADVDGADIVFNGSTRRIHSHRPKPSPTGEATGELYLLLVE